MPPGRVARCSLLGAWCLVLGATPICRKTPCAEDFLFVCAPLLVASLVRSQLISEEVWNPKTLRNFPAFPPRHRKPCRTELRLPEYIYSLLEMRFHWYSTAQRDRRENPVVRQPVGGSASLSLERYVELSSEWILPRKRARTVRGRTCSSRVPHDSRPER